MILGIDEVGRGPWAGPLVVGAVVLGDATIDGLTDSKKLTKKRREELAKLIYEQAAAVGIGWIHADELDTLGISRSLVEATKQALEHITVPYHEIIIDGTVNFLAKTGKGPYVTTIKKADLLIPSVSAASIVAKVARDAFMTEQDAIYPGYGFAAHVGYGTAAHKKAIEELGVTPLHRQSFAPIKNVVKNVDPNAPTSVGQKAENIAAAWLEGKGHTILERNWKVKRAEIDIVSKKDGVLYFIEVKHRRTSRQGGGMAAITRTKRRQMEFAAKLYIHWHNLYTVSSKVAAIATTGKEPTFEQYLEAE